MAKKKPTTKRPLAKTPENRSPVDGQRDAAGRFPKGVSGNPGGRPRGQREFAEMLRALTNDMELQANFCVDLVAGRVKKSGAMVRLMAAQWLTDRTIGKAPDKLELTGKDGGPVEVNDARERLATRLAALLAAPDRDPGTPTG